MLSVVKGSSGRRGVGTRQIWAELEEGVYHRRTEEWAANRDGVGMRGWSLEVKEEAEVTTLDLVEGITTNGVEAFKEEGVAAATGMAAWSSELGVGGDGAGVGFEGELRGGGGGSLAGDDG
ncbi:uncharacterized protein A4U43_C03F29460 [Asparagus officinalis]|uniref:Uncharacterized protein n=1 Tax=Asparagus officinalis TaxID=4686 RepID=A0A5P1FEM9_ASPOF|nr:uncharacterized protein A4U43_C03F29460 [Asparagus officinalis]